MGRTALYRDPVPFRPARAEIYLDHDVLGLRMPDGRLRRHVLDGTTPTASDGFVLAWVDAHYERRFVRMLILESDRERTVVITPPDRGALAPNVVNVPEAPSEAAIVDERPFDALTEWVLGGGRLAALAIPELAQLAAISTAQFAVLIGEVAAQRALELVWSGRGPLRGGWDLDSALQPLSEAARDSPRAAEALVSALAHAAGAVRPRRRGA